jgi:ribosome biogenesis GTPase
MQKRAKGLVTKVFGRHYTVESGGIEYDSFLKGKMRIDSSWHQMTNPVAVGDNVDIIIENDSAPRAVIESVCERKNKISRKEKGKNSREDIIAANLDLIMIVQSFSDPFMNLRFADRVYVKANNSSIPVALCVNKSDLSCDETESYLDEYYSKSGLKIFKTSCVSEEGINEVASYIKNKHVLFIGVSGCGKSSLINKIFPEKNLKVSEVSESTGKGRHTTTNTIMYRIDSKTAIIDSPGLREFGIPDIEEYELSDYFYEFKKYSSKCQFSGCSHDHEPGCEIQRALDKGKIYEGRYISYINILESLREYKRWKYR